MIITKVVNLGQLQTELAAAGVTVNALGTTGDDLFTYDKQGVPCELPDGAAAVVAAHVPKVDTTPTIADQVAALQAAVLDLALGGF